MRPRWGGVNHVCRWWCPKVTAKTKMAREKFRGQNVKHVLGLDKTATGGAVSVGKGEETGLAREALTTTVGRCLTSLTPKPSLVIEQATSSYSFRSPELSQPI